MKFWVIDECKLLAIKQIELERKEHKAQRKIRARYAKRQREYSERYIANFDDLVATANSVNFNKQSGKSSYIAHGERVNLG